ncbi:MULTISPECIES: LysR family transcriptional regulator [unclassified Sulfitobacter]|uniref:LysR family transcriptional regulator n=1 Tax=unclassified Sulfitobacter TaxID=196795 RepID=UPI0007C20805|nr:MULTISPECIES: LysR family transcriptional regulator [unclassified Sulfitobacter]KZX97189.1 LysR family transcriptional regulator [Sulfitobacter sp. HI0027]KZX97796.1 LysR family transcriptional regulator [Sulfitobacter sp. HI0021]
MRQRRFLPSTKLLLALDAVVRHGSVTAAAKELNLTQSTVSRLILTLEQQLGRELFVREKRRMTPNAAALNYQREVSRALDMIHRSSMSVVANPNGGTLSLAVPPTFASRWLGPRLGKFMGENPGVLINMSTRIGKLNFESEVFDAVIYCGLDDWEGVDYLKLFEEKVTACVSVEFSRTHRLHCLDNLRGLPMLQLESQPDVWADWFREQGGEPPDPTGMLMDQFSMMIQAAIEGLGIAILPDYLAQIEITEGRLVPVLEPAVPLRQSYWLAWPHHKDSDAPLRVFREWLGQEGKIYLPSIHLT